MPSIPEVQQEAYLEFGKARIPEIQTLIERSIPYCKAFQIFWNGLTFHFIFEEELNQRWATNHHAELRIKVQQLLAAADPQQQFPEYPVSLLFGYGETVLFQESTAAANNDGLPSFAAWRWNIAPWIALPLGCLWLLIALISSRGNVRWREIYPAVSLIAAGFFLLGINRWYRNAERRATESPTDQPPPTP